MTKVTISRWGDSAAIRLPEAVMQELRLKEGDVVELSVGHGTVAVGKVLPAVAPTLAEIVAEIKRLGPENEPETVDWGRDVGSERFYDHD
jgi:antitoxin MazE